MAYQTRYGRPVRPTARLNNYEVPRSRPTQTRATAPAVAVNNFVGPAPQVQAANISREDLQEEVRQTRLKISICEEKLRRASLSQV